MKQTRSGPDDGRTRGSPGGGHLTRWGWYSIGVNTLLAVLHGLIAAQSGSIAVAAELAHNIVDLLASSAVLIGLKLAMRESKAFPYGLYKVENLVAAGLAVLIFLTAYEITHESLLAARQPVRTDVWMLAILVVTMTIPLVFSRFELRAGRFANSPALMADAKEYRIHAFTTGLAFAALASAAVEFPLDRVAALVIVLAVVKTGWDLLRDSMRVLLDASLDGETLQRVSETIRTDPAVREVSWVTGRSAGRFRFIEAGLALRVAELTKAESAIRRIEADIRSAVPHVDRILVHVEAQASGRIRYAIPLADRAGTVSEHFGEAPFFAFVTLCSADGAVEQQRIEENPYSATERAKGIRVAEWLVAQKADGVLLREDLRGKGPEYVLRDAGVVICPVESAELGDAVAALRSTRRPDKSPGQGAMRREA